MIQQPFLGQTAGGQVPLPTASQGPIPSSILYASPISTASTTGAAYQPPSKSFYNARGNVPPVSMCSAFVGDGKSNRGGSQPGSQVTAAEPPDMDFYHNCPLEELRRDLGRANEILGDSDAE